MGGSSKQTVGYRYGIGLHMGLCHGPVDAVLAIKGGDRTAWTGLVTETTRIQINAPDLYGGDEKEGGIVGALDIEFGDSAQSPNDYLAAKIGVGRPAYRGILGLVWRGGQITANNPYIKPLSTRVRRIVAGWTGGAAWYAETAPVLLSGSAGETAELLGRAAVGGGATLGALQIATNIMGVYPTGETWTAPAVVMFELPNLSQTAEPPYDELTYPRRVIVRRQDNDVVVWDSGWVGLAIDQGGLDLLLTDVGRLDLSGSIRAAASYQSTVDIGGPGALVAELIQATIDDGRPGLVQNVVNGYSPNVTDSRVIAMNPAHIIYECLTDTAWGMGYDASIIDADSFAAAADTFFAEGLGLCLQWTQQDSIQAFVQVVLDHAGAVLVEDRRTLLHKLVAIRGDYDVETLPHFGDTLGNVHSLEQLQRAAVTDTVNELTVQYTDIETGKTGSVTVQNLAANQASGRVISQTRSYPGLPTADLALRVAIRDLDATTSGLARSRVVVNRDGYDLYPGAVIRFSWEPDGIVQMPLRVLDADYGSFTDGRITLEVVEDVFGLPDTVYVQPTPPPSDPDVDPQAAVGFELLEAPYREVLRRLGRTETAIVPDDAGYIAGLAASPAGYSQNYRLYTRTGSDAYERAATGDWAPHGTLSAGIGATTTTMTLDDGDRVVQIEAGTIGMFGSGRSAELVRIDSIDPDTGEMVIARGCLDTTPAVWAYGTRFWGGVDDYGAAARTEYVLGETVDALALTVAATGTLAELDAPNASITLDQRQFRPYPPGRLRISDNDTPDAAYPASCVGELTVAWAHRDRLLQEDQIIDEAEGDIGPEAGTTYTVRWYVDGELVETEASISGSSATPYTPAEGIVRVAVVSVRGGLESWQAAECTFAYGVGLIDGRITEDESLRLIESGEQRIIEEAT